MYIVMVQLESEKLNWVETCYMITAKVIKLVYELLIKQYVIFLKHIRTYFFSYNLLI